MKSAIHTIFDDQNFQMMYNLIFSQQEWQKYYILENWKYQLNFVCIMKLNYKEWVRIQFWNNDLSSRNRIDEDIHFFCYKKRARIYGVKKETFSDSWMKLHALAVLYNE